MAVAEGDIMAAAVVVFWYGAVGSMVDAEAKLETPEEIAVFSGMVDDLVVFSNGAAGSTAVETGIVDAAVPVFKMMGEALEVAAASVKVTEKLHSRTGTP